MQSVIRLLKLGLLAVGLFGCETGRRPNIAEINVAYSWDGVELCSTVSPQIKVFDVPAATKRLRIEVFDLESILSRRGEVEIEYRGTGVIPPGAVKSFRGPCPSYAVERTRYEIKVSALNAAGELIGVGSNTQAYASPKLLPRR